MKVLPPDFMQDGPWSTFLYIKRQGAPSLVITVRDHANGGAKAYWTSIDSVVITAWWGRIRESEFYLDPTTGTVKYSVDRNHFEGILPCRNGAKTQPNNSGHSDARPGKQGGKL